MKRIILIAVVVVFVVGVVSWQLSRESNPENYNVPIKNIYNDKIVYDSTDESIRNLLILDCRERGGNFRTCGSTCESSATVCVDVCAYTCEDLNINN